VNNIFDLFDADGRGIITSEHLKKLANMVGEQFSPDQLDLIASYASSNKKDISREDFYLAVAKQR
jgi:Ca2+-binding EF-hand superfamily protein